MTGTPTPEPTPEPIVIPPLPPNERGFDFFMNPGVDLIKSLDEEEQPSPPISDGEYPAPIPPGWDNFEIDITGDPPKFDNGTPPIMNHTYAMRYWQTRSDYNEIDNTHDQEVVYPAWELVSQTFEQISAEGDPIDREVFIRTYDEEGEVEEVTYPISYTGSVNGGTVLGTGGIINETRYGYVEVFNECEISWLPRCSTLLQPPIKQKTMPLADNNSIDLPYPYYNVDTINAVVTDERLYVLIRYRVTTVYKAALIPSASPDYDPGTSFPMVEYTHTQIINQYCIQDPEIDEDKMEAILNNGYFTQGFYHDQLYDVNARPNYNSDARPIGPVIEPAYEVNEEATNAVGFTVYKLLNTVWNPNGLDDVPSQEEESAVEEEKREEERKEQISGLEETMASVEANYAAELDPEAIEKNQEEYKEFVQANKDKKQLLLDNMLTMMNLPAGSVPEITPENLNQFIAEANQRNTNGGN